MAFDKRAVVSFIDVAGMREHRSQHRPDCLRRVFLLKQAAVRTAPKLFICG
jgi:hypothetical protein